MLISSPSFRAQLLAYTANLPSSLIGLEPCAGGHFMGTALQKQGHKVRLIPAQFIKPYRPDLVIAAIQEVVQDVRGIAPFQADPKTEYK